MPTATLELFSEEKLRAVVAAEHKLRKAIAALKEAADDLDRISRDAGLSGVNMTLDLSPGWTKEDEDAYQVAIVETVDE